jgi:hypothetical protein
VSDLIHGPERVEALRAARQGLVAVRFLCAIGFTTGGFFLAAVESAYQAFAPLNYAINRDRNELFEHPERPEAQLRAGVAEVYRSHVRRASDFADGVGLWASGLLTSLGVIGMIIGNRLGVVIARLNADRMPKVLGTSFDPEFG